MLTYEVIFSLCSREAPPGVWPPAWGPLAQGRNGSFKAGPEDGHEVVRGMEHVSCEDQGEFELFSQQKRRLREILLQTSII